jgi:hypothetical protein
MMDATKKNPLTYALGTPAKSARKSNSVNTTRLAKLTRTSSLELVLRDIMRA